VVLELPAAWPAGVEVPALSSAWPAGVEVPDLSSAWPAGVDVLSVDLDVRHASAEEARRSLSDAAARLRTHADLFVKIDSTLRGPVAALVEGALEGSQSELAVVAPAFPEQGRVYVDGSFGGVSVREVLGAVASRCRIQDDLTGVRMQEGVLLVGSGGLARRLAGPGRGATLPKVHGRVLVVAGSPAAETQSQLERLPPSGAVLRTPATSERDAGEAATELAQRVAAHANQSTRPDLLVLTGGQTARLTCEALGVRSLELIGEVLPGVPVGHMRGGPWDGTVVVTKAGAFGGPTALLDVLRLLGPSSRNTP
jgi:D-threonate/D-erythronate kinase